MKTVEDEKRKQQVKENSMKSKQGTASQLPSYHVSPHSHVLPHSLQKPGGNQSINREDALKQLMGGPSGTPNTVRYPDYSTDSATPLKPQSKENKRQVAGHDYDDDETATRLDFSSPTRSPSHNQQEENELFSPARSLRL